MQIKIPKTLFILPITLFLVTAHSAPARATHPLVLVGQNLEQANYSKPVALSEVTDKKKMGLALESKETKKLLNIQALQFLSYGSSARDSEKYLAKVCTAPKISTNPFCGLEVERQNHRNPPVLAPILLTDAEADTTRSKSISPNELISSDPEKLNFYSLGALARAMRSFDNFAPLQTLTDKTLAAKKTCYSSALYTSLGMKSEEYFPDQDAIDLTQKLYARAAECSSDEPSMRARYRLSLIRIWQNSCDHVVELLGEVEQSPLALDYQSRSRYWRYQCANKLGLTEIKEQSREALWQKNQMSYHNIAINGDDPRLNSLLGDSSVPLVQFRSLLRPDLNASVRAIETLLRLQHLALASEFIDLISPKLASTEPEFRLYLAALADRSGNSIPKFKILSSLMSDNPRFVKPALLRLYFPLSFYSLIRSRATAIDPLLVLSLMRQESAFNQMAHSAVGARGLMQVMPATARYIASVSSRHLYDPPVNIHVGTKYLTNRLEYFNGEVGPTLAAYNAGVGRVDRWIKRYPGADKVLFADLIPFKETREYVASILRNHFWYTRLYSKAMLRETKPAGRKTAGM